MTTDLQPSLWRSVPPEPRPKPTEPTAPYVKGSETSKAAAEDILASLGEKQRRVYDLFCLLGEMSDNALIAAYLERYGGSPNTPRPRRIELTALGLVEDTGKRTDSRTPSIIWRAVRKETER